MCSLDVNMNLPGAAMVSGHRGAAEGRDTCPDVVSSNIRDSQNPTRILLTRASSLKRPTAANRNFSVIF